MYKDNSEVFKVLSDVNRLHILHLLVKGETCGCTLIDKLEISQPTLSHHLKRIASVGLTDAKKKGTKTQYYVNKDKLDEVIQFLQDLKNCTDDSCQI